MQTFFKEVAEITDYIIPVMEFVSLLFMIVLAFESFLKRGDDTKQSKLCRLCLVLTIVALVIEVESYVFDGDMALRTLICRTGTCDGYYLR